MKLSRVRFTLRRLMTAVAAVALLMTTGKAGWHSLVCWKLAEYNAGMATTGFSRCGIERPTAEEEIAYQRWNGMLKDYHARMEKKYRRALWRPWEPVLPDPPAPGM